MARLDQLLHHLTEADCEKLAFALRQTVKRITLRRTRLADGRHRVTLWHGLIELCDDLGPKATITLTHDDLPSPGRWRDAARLRPRARRCGVHRRGGRGPGRQQGLRVAAPSPSDAGRQDSQPAPSGRLERRVFASVVVRFLHVFRARYEDKAGPMGSLHIAPPCRNFFGNIRNGFW